MVILYIDIEALREEPCLNTEHTDYNLEQHKLLVAKSKSGRVFYNTDYSKSFSVLHTTATIDHILELYSSLVIQWAPEQLFGTKLYAEDGAHTGYTSRDPNYPKYKTIWDDMPDTDLEGTRPPLLPHGIKTVNAAELNLTPESEV